MYDTKSWTKATEDKHKILNGLFFARRIKHWDKVSKEKNCVYSQEYLESITMLFNELRKIDTYMEGARIRVDLKLSDDYKKKYVDILIWDNSNFSILYPICRPYETDYRRYFSTSDDKYCMDVETDIMGFIEFLFKLNEKSIYKERELDIFKE